MEGDQPRWNSSAYQLNTTSNCFFNPNWDGSMDQNDPFESALSSLVSSPAASNAGAGDGFVISELIGKLGSVCKSGEVSPQSCVAGSRNTSCYNTPLNSPPKLNLSSVTESQIRANFGQHQLPPNLGLSPFSNDPGFVERAAKFSCFGSTSLGGLVGARFGSEFGHGSLPNLQGSEMSDSREGSSVSEQNLGGEFAIKPQGNTSSRKRKANPKAKGPVKEAKAVENDESSNAKRSKTDEDKEKSNTDVEENENDKDIKKETKQPEPPQDFIHVRARRGQATDSHSLAERARREKISERMKFLQDLVPGCNKVTGKAIVLDEIINYVQSLQRQVEFLSMKLATVNPRMEFNMEALLSKDMLQLPPTMLPLDSSAPVFPYGFQSQQIQTIPNDVHNPFSVNLLDAAIRQNAGIQVPSTDGFGDSAHQIPAFWEDDLHSIIQMGFSQNLQAAGTNPTTQMKIEL